ncbi:MAG: tetratricopeptide repeat protein [Phycisphaerales bacterium]|nr:tetratricopeptide repeat protein [Phycisphaerae bacterium]NNF43370.1 tetratricopeptide repeat protein [Phycisphaerales bacterium]NNM25541.1 tetratricopeptide repeat protein [Phycisphaerales bacterium]
MKIRSILTLAAVAGLFAAGGCNGPTKAGLEARANAQERIADFGAEFTYDQARQEFEVGQFKRALRTIDQAIAARPTVGEFHVLRGRILLETGRLEAAAASFQTAAEQNESLAEAYYYQGIVHQRWNEDEQAFDAYARAFELERDNVQYLLASAEALVAFGQYAQAREKLEDRMVYFENNSAMRHLLAQIAVLEGDDERAAELYDEARVLDPEDAHLLEEHAWVQYDAHRFGPCLETIKQLKSTSTTPRPDLDHLEARCLAMLDRSNEAYSKYINLSQDDPNNVSIWIEMGTLAWRLGDHRRMAECSQRTIELAPDRFEGYMLKGLFERHRGRLDQAIEQLENAAQRSLSSALPHMLLGQTLEDAGRQESALAIYGHACRIEPANSDAEMLRNQLAAKMEVASAE